MKSLLLRTALLGLPLWLTAALSGADYRSTYLAAARYESGGDVVPLRQIEQWVGQSLANEALRLETETGLVELLRGEATFEARRFACQQLAVIGREAAVPALATLLDSSETVGMACLALAVNPAPRASAVLRRRLEQASGLDQAQIAHALGVRRDGRSVATLGRLSRSGTPAVAEAAVIALGQIGTGPAQEALAQLRRDAPETLRRAVADASLRVADQLLARGNRRAASNLYTELMATVQPDDIRRGALGGLLRLDPDGGEERMLRVLSGRDQTLKPVAIAALPGLKREGASEKFAPVLPGLAPFDQILLLQALSQRGDPAARAAVRRQLTSTNAEVRLAAIQVEGADGNAESVSALAHALLGFQAPADQRAIELALSRLPGGNDVDRALAAQLRNRMAGPKTPFLAALVRRANPESLRLFLAEAASTDAATAKLAFQGLSRVAGPDDLAAVLKALGGLRVDSVLEDAQAAVGQVLRRAGTPARASAAVRDALKTAPGFEGQQRFLPLLTGCPDAEGLALVEAAAQAADAPTRSLGLRTLADWPETSAWTPLAAAYRGAASETERVLALRGLARLLGDQNAKPDAQLLARYRDLFASAKGDTDRKLVLGALAGCAHPDALALAVEQLAIPGVRAEATFAVKNIAGLIKAQHPQAAEAALQKLRDN
jgi:HEAT repeat protein